MNCSKCGEVMPKIVVGNIIDYKHPGILAECPPQPKRLIPLSDSWEPAAKHYRDIVVTK